jgi:hypothetical protein
MERLNAREFGRTSAAVKRYCPIYVLPKLHVCICCSLPSAIVHISITVVCHVVEQFAAVFLVVCTNYWC